jgi:dienelactone hydrolase
MKYVSALLLVLLLAGNAAAEIKMEPAEYKQGDATLKSELYFDDARTGPRPGVLVIPEWWGLNDYARSRAKQLAELGYVAMAVDIYGDGFTTTDPAEAGRRAGQFKNDRQLLRARATAALAELKTNANVNPAQTAAIGYCFGGMTVLELARSGADLKGVVSFHGSLDSPSPEDGKNIKASVLVLHGADDPFISAANMEAFQKELRDSDADWQLIIYSNANHGFTNPNNEKLGMDGVGYNKSADKRSWKAMKVFFSEIFKP